MEYVYAVQLQCYVAFTLFILGILGWCSTGGGGGGIPPTRCNSFIFKVWDDVNNFPQAKSRSKRDLFSDEH